MKFGDFISISTGNLWRMKLRAFLTISGVIIAIAAFVAMLSFGAGMQKNVSSQYEKLGLFTTMQVFPKKDDKPADTTRPVLLDNKAVAAISQIPGVRLVYPFNSFTVTAGILDTQLSLSAQALPITAIQTKAYSNFSAGSAFESDSAKEVVVTGEFLRKLHIDNPDSLIGKELIISIRVASIDSGIVHIIPKMDSTLKQRLDEIQFDSLIHTSYIKRVVRQELGYAMGRFLDGFFNAKALVSDTLIIRGVLDFEHGGPIRINPLIIPAATAARFSEGGITDDPAALFASLQSGTLLASETGQDARSYPKVTVDLEPDIPYTTISDSIKTLGFRTFSYAEEFAEIQKFFIYFDMGLGVIGLIALITASLGIVNTMVMSIIERRREIGILKSLGADEGDIRLLFLAESGLIGTIGASFGILFGWVITRIASMVIKMIMQKQNIPEMELFALPPRLILTALLFGLLVSLAAGFYPASRASRVDPVEALRTE
ncbi:MAG: FtsX-like permease family protein [Candidatus Zixiibacteriota bacterium]